MMGPVDSAEIPPRCSAEIDLGAWALPEVFAWLRGVGGMDEREMLKTFNCGIGMIVVVDADRAGALKDVLDGAGETVVELGRVVAGEGVRYTGAL